MSVSRANSVVWRARAATTTPANAAIRVNPASARNPGARALAVAISPAPRLAVLGQDGTALEQHLHEGELGEVDPRLDGYLLVEGGLPALDVDDLTDRNGGGKDALVVSGRDDVVANRHIRSGFDELQAE